MTIVRPLLAAALVLGVAVPAASARAELATWDQAKVTALAQQLTVATKQLEDAFRKHSVPSAGSGQTRDYYRLKQLIRSIRQDANSLEGDLANGDRMEATQPAYADLMLSVRDAREVAARIFATQDVKDRATAVRTVLNEITPYYDADAAPLEPTMR